MIKGFLTQLEIQFESFWKLNRVLTALVLYLTWLHQSVTWYWILIAHKNSLICFHSSFPLHWLKPSSEKNNYKCWYMLILGHCWNCSQRIVSPSCRSFHQLFKLPQINPWNSHETHHNHYHWRLLFCGCCHMTELKARAGAINKQKEANSLAGVPGFRSSPTPLKPPW